LPADSILHIKQQTLSFTIDLCTVDVYLITLHQDTVIPTEEEDFA